METNKAIKFCSSKINYITEKVNIMQQKIKKVDSHGEEIVALKNEIKVLKSDIEDQSQRARMNNIEIRNIPQAKTENLLSIVNEIFTSIEFQWDNNDIEFINRVASRKPDDKKIKPIVLKFTKKTKKDMFLFQYKNFKGLTTEGAGIPGDAHKIFISDHLTAKKKDLLRKAKNAAKEKGFFFVWVSDCKIFTRRDQDGNSLVIRIQREEDLKKIS